jgi:hypothetical protein
MANEVFNESWFLAAIDKTKLSPQGLIEFEKRVADIEKKKALALKDAIFATVKLTAQGKVKPLLTLLNSISMPSYIQIVNTWLLKSVDKGMFAPSADWTEKLKGDQKVPNFCDTLLNLFEYDGADVYIESKLGSPIAKQINDVALWRSVKKRILAILSDPKNAIAFWPELTADITLSYLIAYESTADKNEWTATVKSHYVDSPKEKTPSAPKVDADGNAVESSKESAPKGYNWLTYTQSIAESHPNNPMVVYLASIQGKQATIDRFSYYAKKHLNTDNLSQYIEQ